MPGPKQNTNENTSDSKQFTAESYTLFRKSLAERIKKAYEMLNMDAIEAAKDQSSPLHSLKTFAPEKYIHSFQLDSYRAPDNATTDKAFIDADENLHTVTKFLENAAKEFLKQTFEKQSPLPGMWGKGDTPEEFLKAVFFNTREGQYDNGDFFIDKTANRYKDFTINSYLNNLRQYGKGGEIEQAFNQVTKSSPNFVTIQAGFEALQANINETLSSMNLNTVNGLEFPVFDMGEAKNLNQLCTNYLETNGYKDEPENKAVRTLKQATDRTIMNQTKERAKFLEGKLKDLSRALKSVDSRGLLSNSKEFNLLQESLKDFYNPNTGVIDPSKLEALQHAAKNYMDEKINDPHFSGSKRRTPKGQLRFDIASEIYDLCSNYHERETTLEELNAVKRSLGKTVALTQKEKIERQQLEKEEAEEKARKEQEEFKKNQKSTNPYKGMTTEQVLEYQKEMYRIRLEEGNKANQTSNKAKGNESEGKINNIQRVNPFQQEKNKIKEKLDPVINNHQNPTPPQKKKTPQFKHGFFGDLDRMVNNKGKGM